MYPTDYNAPFHDVLDAPTIYDLEHYYGYTFANLIGTYPIWDETQREWLNTQVENYFMYREIGAETPAQFALFLNQRMNRIMPRVNNIAAFALDNMGEDWQDGLKEVIAASGTQSTEATDTTSATSTETPNRTTQTDSTTESKASALASTTPQTQLSGAENYMTNLNETGSSGTTGATVHETGTTNRTSSGTNTTEGETTTTSDTTRTVASGQLSEMAAKWAATMPDLLGLVFEGLEPCFCQVY